MDGSSAYRRSEDRSTTGIRRPHEDRGLPGARVCREVLRQVRNHFAKNTARMQYKGLRSADLEIGSGVVEGACTRAGSVVAIHRLLRDAHQQAAVPPRSW